MIQIRRVVACVAALLLFIQPAAADVLVLLDGQRHVGVIANRDAVRETPHRQSRIAILISDSDELLRFQTAEIDHIVFEEDGESYVIDMTEQPPPTKYTTPPRPVQTADTDTGVALMLSGAAIGLLGALVKFGDEKATITESSIDYDEKSYNGLNYAMMGLGGVMFILGASTSLGPASADSDAGVEPSLACKIEDGHPVAFLGISFIF